MRTARRYFFIISAGLFLLGFFLIVTIAPGTNAVTYLLPRSRLPLSGEFPVVQSANDLLRPAIANGELLVWYAQGEAGLDVFGLQLELDDSSDGYIEGDPFLIDGSPGDQAVPAIAASTADGNYLVVWHSEQNGTGTDIYARYLDAEGNPQGASFAISAAEGDQFRPDVAYSPDADTFIVVWQDDRVGNDIDLYARPVPASQGSALGEEFVVSSAFSDQLIPGVACEAGGTRCLAVWMDDRNNDFFYTDIMGRLIDAASGEALGDKIDIAVEQWYQDSPAIIYNPVSAEYMVVWNDDISCRIVSRDGQPYGAGRTDVSLESPFQWKPALAVDENGQYLVIWEDGRNQDNRGTDIYGQWLSPSGVPLGANFALSTNGHDQYWPALTFDPNTGKYFAVWEDKRDNGTIGLYGQMLSH